MCKVGLYIIVFNNLWLFTTWMHLTLKKKFHKKFSLHKDEIDKISVLQTICWCGQDLKHYAPLVFYFHEWLREMCLSFMSHIHFQKF